MFAFSFLVPLALLSAGDIGTAQVTGPLIRVPIVLYWNGIDDNYTTTAAVSGYERIRTEGSVSKNNWPGTLPLKLYYSPTRDDHWLLANPESEESAKDTGYRFVRNEGYIFQGPIPGMVPLKTYWRSARGDHANVAEARSETDQKNSGYTFVRVEGYVFPANDPNFGAQALSIPVFSGSDSRPKDRVETAYKTSFVVHPDLAASGCRYSWIGTVAGANPHDVVITICDTGVVGRYSSTSDYLVDPSRMSRDAIFEGRVPPTSSPAAPGPAIDIAIGYTSSVLESQSAMLNRISHPSIWPKMTAVAYMRASLQLAVDHLNSVLGASGVPAALRLVNTKEFNNILEEAFTDPQDALKIIAPSGTSADPYRVKAFRDSTGADLVSLWMDSRRLGGRENGVGNYLGGFSVVKAVEATDSRLTFAHEVAHNFGAHHSVDHDDVEGPSYARGHVFDADGSPGFYTIMSGGYSCSGCKKIPYFSNPAVRIDPMIRGWSLTGQPAGVAGKADNARRIREEAGRVAAFRTLKCPGNAPAGCGSGSPGAPPVDPDDPPVFVP
ncbi:MAG: hypothetical protein IT161_17490 [Bryobacterales bacterium]|nr:hypothetical protein [Bryobacterales bacterium]